MTTPSQKVVWVTRLSSAAQDLVSRQDRDSRLPEYRRNEVKEAADDLTVAEIRQVSVELSDEADRLRYNLAIINDTKEALRRVVGL